MQQGAGAPAPAMDISPESLRVLVVESNPSSRASTVQLLKDCSYQVRPEKSVVLLEGHLSPGAVAAGGC